MNPKFTILSKWRNFAKFGRAEILNHKKKFELNNLKFICEVI